MNENKVSFAKYHDRKRHHCEHTYTDIEEYFNKRYDFYYNDQWNIPDTKDLFSEQDWKIDQFQIMKFQLNQVKGQLSQFNLAEWSQHTKTRDPSGYIFRQLKKYINPEILTQAWCKFYECISKFPIINEVILSDNSFNSFHLCEAPGAFISALNHYLVSNHSNLQWNWLVNSLNPEYEGNDLSCMIPDKRLMNFTRNHWCFGSDNSGDITKFYNHETIISDSEQLGKIHLVTADGSIDCMSNPGEQESLVCHLHFCEVITALTILAPDGSFVIKMFTLFESSTICILYLLYNCFESVHVFKPCSSKSGNSEIYVICLKYKAKDQFMQIRDKLLLYYKNPDLNLSMFPLKAISNNFISQIEECNMFFMSKQIKTINSNIYCFKNLLPNEYRKNEELKKAISDCFLSKYKVRQIDKQKYFTHQKFMPALELFIYDYIYENSTANILFNNENIIELCFVMGKEISKVLYSEFCDINFLKNFHKCSQTFSSVLKKYFKKNVIQYEHIIEIDYSNNNKTNSFNIFHNFYETLLKITCGQNIIINGFLFLTRFEASLLFLLLYCFTSIECYPGQIILKNATMKLNEICDIFNKINIKMTEILHAENYDFPISLLNILPNTLLRSQSYLKFLFDYNNNTLDFFFKNK